MAGEKFGYFRRSEGTEGEDGSLSSGCGLLEVLCVWRWKLTTDCTSFVWKKWVSVISCYRSCGRWWRRTEEIIKYSEAITHVWSAVDLVVIMWGFGSVDFSRRKMKATIDTFSGPTDRLISTIFSLPLRSLVRCSRRTSDNWGLEGAVHAGLEERGQMSSRQEVKVEHKVSVAAFTSRDEKWVGEGREEDTTEERWEGEWEQ